MGNVRLTPLGKVIALLIIAIILSFFTVFEKKSNAQNYIAANETNSISKNEENAELLSGNADSTSKQDIKVADVSREMSLSIFYLPNHTEISSEYQKSLDLFVEMANLSVNSTIQIEGNTANPANDLGSESDKKLSLTRAKAAGDYLMQKGIRTERLILIANGSDKPLGDNSTDAGRKLNRRADISIKTSIRR